MDDEEKIKFLRQMGLSASPVIEEKQKGMPKRKVIPSKFRMEREAYERFMEAKGIPQNKETD